MKNILTGLLLALIIVASPIIAKSINHAPHLTFQVMKEVMVINKRDIISAKIMNQRNSFPAIDINLNQSAAKRLAKLSSANIGHVLTARVGDQIVNQATITSKLGARIEMMVSSKALAEKVLKSLN